MLARPAHMPVYPKTITIQHAVAAAIMVSGAWMLDIRRPGRKIERMKQTAIGLMDRCCFPSIDGDPVSPRRFALIITKMQLARFFLDKAIGDGRKNR
jgi:hypothetical protein